MFVTLVAIPEVLAAISVTLVAIPDALVVMFVTLVAISVLLELILVVFSLILDSTFDILPKVNVPSISASFRMVTVPEV